MGREIIIEAKKGRKELYSDFVCGRDSATGYIANLVYNSPNKKTRETYTLVFHLGDKELVNIKSELQEYADKDNFEIEKAKSTIEDLKIARRNSRTAKDFTDFSEMIDNTYEWLEQEGFSRAQSIIEMITKAERTIQNNLIQGCLESYPDKNNDELENYKINIIVSE